MRARHLHRLDALDRVEHQAIRLSAVGAIILGAPALLLAADLVFGELTHRLAILAVV